MKDAFIDTNVQSAVSDVFFENLTSSAAKKGLKNELSEEELLVKKINSMFPKSQLALQKRLLKKLQLETISEAEHRQLTELNDWFLVQATDRIYLLIRLAEIRNISPKEVMKHPDIQQFDREKTPPNFI